MWPSFADYAWLPAQITLAWAVDLLLGDPSWFPHPVRIIGQGVVVLEKLLRWSRLPLRVGGALLTIVIVGGSYGVVGVGLAYVARLHPWAGRAAGVVVLYFCFATRCLASEAKKIERLLRSGDLAGARRAVGMIVGRDTYGLDERGVCRAVVETVAENSADGVVTPMFYAFVGGPALAMAYKAASTLDSMVGYRDERYRELGWPSARLEDVFSFAPARLTVGLVAVAAWVLRLHGGAAWRVARRDGRKHPSPNAGLAEAAFAGALGVQLGGVATYGGVASEKPLLGDAVGPVSCEVIGRSVRLLYGTSATMLVLGVGVALAALHGASVVFFS